MKHFVARMCAPKKAESDQLLMSFVLNQYWDDVAPTAGSGDTAKRIFEHMLSYYADSTVADINKKSNKQYEKEMREKNGWSNSTINRYRNFLRAALEHAVENEDLQAAPIIPTLPEPPARNRRQSAAVRQERIPPGVRPSQREERDASHDEAHQDHLAAARPRACVAAVRPDGDQHRHDREGVRPPHSGGSGAGRERCSCAPKHPFSTHFRFGAFGQVGAKSLKRLVGAVGIEPTTPPV
jgi:Phage integrase SAM-like domain